MILSLILISDFKTRKKSNDYIVFLIMLLFSFFNGLGVFTILENDILGNVSVFLPVLLCTIGAVISVILILFLIFLLKLVVLKVKKIANKKWSLAFPILGCLISIYLMIGKLFE